MNKINVAHREAKNWSDKVALTMVRIMRWGLDTATGYKHDKEVAKAKLAPGETPQFAMNEKKYMIRYEFSKRSPYLFFLHFNCCEGMSSLNL